MAAVQTAPSERQRCRRGPWGTTAASAARSAAGSTGVVAAAEAKGSLPPVGSHWHTRKASPAGRRPCARRETEETPWTSGQRREAAALPQRALSAWLDPHAPRRDAHPCSGAGHSPAVQTHGAASRVAPAVQRAHAATSPAGTPLAVLRCGCLRRSGPHQGPGRASDWVEQRCAIRKRIKICLQSVRR